MCHGRMLFWTKHAFGVGYKSVIVTLAAGSAFSECQGENCRRDDAPLDGPAFSSLLYRIGVGIGSIHTWEMVPSS